MLAGYFAHQELQASKTKKDGEQKKKAKIGRPRLDLLSDEAMIDYLFDFEGQLTIRLRRFKEAANECLANLEKEIQTDLQHQRPNEKHKSAT
jgi:hypothetical protein